MTQVRIVDAPLPARCATCADRSFRCGFCRGQSELDAATRLAPAEASELAALLKGRVSWRGVRALAHELGISEETIHRAIRRARMQPRTVARLRAALAARAVGAYVVTAAGGGGAS